MLRLIFAALLLAWSAVAGAQFRDGNRLLQELQSAESRERQYALAYIVGAFDMVNEFDLAANSDTQSFMFCQPTGMTAGQLSDVVRDFLARHPNVRHRPASILIIAALQQAFPCPTPPAPPTGPRF